MGGHSGGEVASAMAVSTVEDVISHPPVQNLSPRDLLTHAYAEASRRIFEKAEKENPELLGMGTTMVLIKQTASSIFVCNVGDSRCYLFRKPHLWQVTEDHSLVNEQLRAGLINEDQVKNFVGRNVITRSVGYERDVTVDILERPVTKGDIFLLCSDGLTGMVSDTKIAQILERNPGAAAAEVCIQEALAGGGHDNVTVLILNIV
jgi:protein phosphatase